MTLQDLRNNSKMFSESHSSGEKSREIEDWFSHDVHFEGLFNTENFCESTRIHHVVLKIT